MSEDKSPHPSGRTCDPGRRKFLGGLAAGMLVTPVSRLSAETGTPPTSAFRSEAEALLRAWCDGMLRQQVNEPTDPKVHGALRCPACKSIHGRCGDAILPLMAMAAKSGEKRYTDAAMALWKWMGNVDSPDGAWTNETDPTSWKGITVFSAIALAEALEWHGDLLDEATRLAMRKRLALAGKFIQEKFTTEYGNINYAAAGAYGLTLLGHLLDEPDFVSRGRELARQVLAFFTPKDRFLFGEGHPTGRRSAKGCYPVDLGYNVEESLPALVQYALLANDKEVLDSAVSSLKTHLEFMLPDGAWDNSWGTRNFKWTYWGSSTADGCQAAFIRLAKTDPVFGAAAMRNMALLRACTHDGLLHGGPHFTDHGVPPCVHHTFAHAKAIAGALHHADSMDKINSRSALPRQSEAGVRHFPEVDVHLAALGPWRATVSGYDWFYRPGLYQATGGTIGMLWHERLGPLLAAGIADYLPVEAHNMQPLPEGGNFALGLRIETKSPDGTWFTNLHDGTANIRHESNDGSIRFLIETRLSSARGNDPESGPCRFRIEYTLKQESFSILVRPLDPANTDWSLVMPLISRANERIEELEPSRWRITKPGGQLLVTSNSAITRIATKRDRTFNPIPGFQVIPFNTVSRGTEPIELTITAVS